MRKVFFVGLIAMLTGCSQESRVSSPEDSGIELQINLSLGSVSTRAVDDPITGNDGEGYVLPFTEVKTLKVDLYKSLEAAPYSPIQPPMQRLLASGIPPPESWQDSPYPRFR